MNQIHIISIDIRVFLLDQIFPPQTIHHMKEKVICYRVTIFYQLSIEENWLFFEMTSCKLSENQFDFCRKTIAGQMNIETLIN